MEMKDKRYTIHELYEIFGGKENFNKFNRDQVDIIHAQKNKHGDKYTIEEKVLDAKKIKAEKVKYFKPVRAK